MPMETPTTTIKWPVIEFTNQRPFAPCEDIPIGAIHQLGLDFTPPEPEEGLRCHYDAANYQMSIEPIVWRTYEQTIPVDALEATINGHRAAQYWVMKPTDWNNRWWFSCMVTFKTSYGVIQQSLFYSPIYSNPDVDCLAEPVAASAARSADGSPAKSQRLPSATAATASPPRHWRPRSSPAEEQRGHSAPTWRIRAHPTG
jgi:hypothetical protein